jgi:hypothetical protein
MRAPLLSLPTAAALEARKPYTGALPDSLAGGAPCRGKASTHWVATDLTGRALSALLSSKPRRCTWQTARGVGGHARQQHAAQLVELDAVLVCIALEALAGVEQVPASRRCVAATSLDAGGRKCPCAVLRRAATHRSWSKKSSTEGVVSPVSVPSPSICVSESSSAARSRAGGAAVVSCFARSSHVSTLRERVHRLC